MIFLTLWAVGYIGEFEIVDDHRGGKIVVELIGRLNKCGVISPRFDLTLGAIEQWTNNLLPSRQFGYIVMTTSLGIMDHEEVCICSLTRFSNYFNPGMLAGSQKKHRRQDFGLFLLKFTKLNLMNYTTVLF